MTNIYTPDLDRSSRIGLEEAIFCEGKSPEDLLRILSDYHENDTSCLLTRLSVAKWNSMPKPIKDSINYDSVSKTGFFGAVRAENSDTLVAIVTAGTSDIAVAREASRTLRHAGEVSAEFDDLGVAGLWRILEKEKELQRYPVVMVVAGMDGALFGVVGGLVGSMVIAVPTSVGYGAANEGHTALSVALANCAPGLSVVNIDNGYGAACAALRALRQIRSR